MEFWRYRSQPGPQVSPAPRQNSAGAFGQVSGPADSRSAFEEGIREGRQAERSRRRRHPLLKLVLAVAALAAHEGSFSKGGAVVDQKLAVAADKAQVAAAKAGQAVKHAGDAIGDTVSDAATKH